MSFSAQAFDAVWVSLDGREQQAIRDKAAWEHMSLSAVMRDWWPDLWQKVQEAPDD